MANLSVPFDELESMLYTPEQVEVYVRKTSGLALAHQYCRWATQCKDEKERQKLADRANFHMLTHMQKCQEHLDEFNRFMQQKQ